MKALEIENRLREVVGRLITEVELSTKQGRQDINLISEEAWIPILKEVFNCPNLINLNRIKQNFPGIDLGDLTDRVAFQVTATAKLDKVKDTLTTFKKHNLPVMKKMHALAADYIKVRPMTQSERLAKNIRLLALEALYGLTLL